MSNLYDLPPSAKYIHKVLTYEGPLTYGEIVEETNLPESTVDDALDRLRQCEDVRFLACSDARVRRYDVARE